MQKFEGINGRIARAMSIYSMVPGSIPGGVALVALKIHGPSMKCCCTSPVLVSEPVLTV